MQSYLSTKSFICKNCLKRLNLFETINCRITTKPSKAEYKKSLSVKTKPIPELKVRQYPRFLKDLDKKILVSKTSTKVSQKSNVCQKPANQILSTDIEHNSQDFNSNESVEDLEIDIDKSAVDWVDINCKESVNNFNALDPEMEEYNDLDIIANESQFSVEESDHEMNDTIDGIVSKSVKPIKKKDMKSKLKSITKKHEEMKTAMKLIENRTKVLSLRNSLKSYIHACIYGDMISRAHSVLLYYRSRSLKKLSAMDSSLMSNDNPIDISVYNVLMKGWARRGKTFRIKEILNLMKSANVSPNTESYAYYLLSLARQLKQPMIKEVLSLIEEMRANHLVAEQVFNNCYINKQEKSQIMNLLNTCCPHFKPEIQIFPKDYCCHLMDSITKSQQKYFNPSEGVNLESLDSWAKEQFSLEIKGNTTIKSIICEESIDSDNDQKSYFRKNWEKTENEWRTVLKESFTRHVKTLQYQSNEINGMTIYPYLAILDTQYYIDAIIEEIRFCANMSEYYSPHMTRLYADLGRKIMLRYLIKTHIRDGTAQDFQELYDKYLEYYKNAELINKYNPREYWQTLMTESNHFYNNDSNDKMWPFHVQIGVGNFLYDLILREIKINLNILKSDSSIKKEVPAFCVTYKCLGDSKYKQEIKAHPTLIKLFQKACLDNLTFDINMLPMLSPPTPWITSRVGGYLLTNTDFVRMPDSNSKWVFNGYNNQSLYPSFDSLNSLSLCPWIINTKILDLAIHLFKNKGNLSLNIPLNQSEFPPLPKILQSMPKTDRWKTYRQRDLQKREQSEMYSLWCDCLYKLSIANHFRNKVFWFPNNMDFRGRVYPVPPHFNHLGSDLSRGILLFAKGQPLGPKGLDWLKIHLINLTGLKKRSSISERLAFANEILPLIIDSADNPLDGSKWWMNSDEQWQTLACCHEIANAIRSGDPTKYICHFAVHQDGSCNGLQHYAALGRDQSGAISVNLHPADRPQDVYSDVAALVEKERLKDAENGVEVAKLLEGFVNRKVVKQTVMTYVYGVTRFGAKLQIYKRLKETETFPKNQSLSAALYLTQKTFLSIQQMFTETRAIQDWLTECARIISKTYGKPVEWVTPLGFPVVQPYHKAIKRLGETFYGVGCETKLEYYTRSDMFQKPNTLKQKNAFPPNFIHSLDSSHMILTSLHCHREGITFASVHDCFWTHPNCVEIMNRLCRQQFVALHSQPILDDLSKHFTQVYGSLPSNVVKKKEMNKSLEFIGKKLKKGSFDLDNVLKSVYFFS